MSRAPVFLLGGYFLVQAALPLRSWFYPQQGAWDVRGFNFAWRMMLVEKTGHVELFAVNPAAGTQERIPLEHYITARQRMIMAQDPHLIRIFAQYLSRENAIAGRPGTEIRAEALATLNGRPS